MSHISHTHFRPPAPKVRGGPVWTLAWSASFALFASAAAGHLDGPGPRLTPYPDEPPELSLSETDWRRLRAGESLSRQGEEETGGRATAVFLVQASPAEVWSVLKQFEHYPDWIHSVQETEVYRRQGEQVDVRFLVRAAGLRFEYSVAHRFRERDRYATWRLDETRPSDLAGSVGMWKVDVVPGTPRASLVTYSVELALGYGVPGSVRRLLVERGLQEATEWVREASAR